MLCWLHTPSNTSYSDVMDALLAAHAFKDQAAVRSPPLTSYSDVMDLNRANTDSGGRAAHAAVSPRPPNPSNFIVTHTEGNTYDPQV
jgi:hypothetical protein